MEWLDLLEAMARARAYTLGADTGLAFATSTAVSSSTAASDQDLPFFNCRADMCVAY